MIKNNIRHMTLTATLFAIGTACSLYGAEYHVSPNGLDSNQGVQSEPFQTISAAAAIAQPGDVITVHEGIYRERVNPPRGGTSDSQRITYRAAPGEKVTIKGSEVIKGWKKVEGDVWTVSLPNRFFGDFNPYSDLIHGDWYEASQPYHTGAVYLNGHWLKEAPRKSSVLGSDAADESESELMNVEFLRGQGVAKVNAVDASARSRDIPVVEVSKNKRCLGPVKDGDWLSFDLDFGKDTVKKLILSTGSPIGGGLVEIRKESATGELLGTLNAGLTAEWTHFQEFKANLNQSLSGKQTIVLVFKTRPLPPASESDAGYWFAEVDENSTTIWAQFKDINPNEELVEINVRQSVIYPEEPFRNYITVRGFTLEQAATPWSPPTAEQIGLIGVNWSKGWVIEDNTVRYSTCTGLTLGKHGDEFDNALNYYRSIRLGLKNGWNKETIGSHLVRNNHILHCGQAGIVGSLGPAFSTITGNEIHEIRQNHNYGGCETGGIKLHGAIDVVIADNHVYRCAHWGGIWLDWMSQGARVSGNLLHDNSNDLMFEMNHGPMLIDNNMLLSRNGILDASGGGAYVHNLIAGKHTIWAKLGHRATPFFKPHSTEVIPDASVAALPLLEQPLTDRLGITADQHDDRFYNNLFVKSKALSAYDIEKFEITAAGNVYLAGAKPSSQERNAITKPAFDPAINLVEKDGAWWLEMKIDPDWQASVKRPLITSELLGRAQVPDAPFENRDGTPYRLDTDYFGEKRNSGNPAPGPFGAHGGKKIKLKVWPKN
jgi:alpha-N-arabinofuranosidase